MRKVGGEVAARKEWLCVYLVYKWVLVVMLMAKVGKSIKAFAPKPPRPRVEPSDLVDENPEEEAAPEEAPAE